ncbi:MAG: acetyl-CoA carboxylase, carboxyltransferase subunit beta [Rickettsiales bacterium]|jgi:acetyl-CoA carboxylase carboxyl transferase subunit beta|nr:acetyl-CoA carboxylase, carboxyltransferase subunit beta [Rickettsiales bacterium]
MNWIKDVLRPKIKTLFSRIRDVPEQLWMPCPKCATLMYRKDMIKHLNVCQKCGHHLPLAIDDRMKSLFDGQFEYLKLSSVTDDPLHFKDLVKYSDKLRQTREKTGLEDAVKVAVGKIGGVKAVVAVMSFEFFGGSMGRYVGEAVLDAARRAVKDGSPMVAVTASGGARMQEGILSLMQMARTTIAAGMLRDARLPYIVVHTNPTMGGVSASFAMLGDVHVAEQGATIGFAGRRVIESSIRHKLPPEFQTAEYVQEQGAVDIVLHRRDLKDVLENMLQILMANREAGKK